MILRKYFGQLILLPVLASPFAALSAPGSYEVTFSPGAGSFAALNNNGQAAGTNGREPIIWHGTTITTLTFLEGHFATGINDFGDLVGWAQKDPGAFVYAPGRGGRYHIPMLVHWYTSEAVAINNAGDVAGFGRHGIGYGTDAYIYTQRRMEFLGSLGGVWSQPSSLNNYGHVVGTSHVNGPLSHAHAFLYKNGQLRDLGTLGGGRSGASDINDLGQIVGYSSTTPPPGAIDGNDHAFLIEGGVMKDLGTLGGAHSWARALNKAGVVVGASLRADNSSVAFVYSRGKMTDLNKHASLPKGWRLDIAVDINDKGQILARACKLQQCNWALLTPRQQKSQLASEDGK